MQCKHSYTVYATHLIKLYILGANMSIRLMHHRPRRHDSATVFWVFYICKKSIWKNTGLSVDEVPHRAENFEPPASNYTRVFGSFFHETSRKYKYCIKENLKMLC